jgi:hypothetical protein
MIRLAASPRHNSKDPWEVTHSTARLLELQKISPPNKARKGIEKEATVQTVVRTKRGKLQARRIRLKAACSREILEFTVPM